ncbi:MAG: hypothetical protein ABR562_01560 [Thermoplasmatota archaeon]
MAQKQANQAGHGSHGQGDEQGNHGHGQGHDHGHDHGDLMDELMEHLQPVLDNAAEGVYVWIDEDNMACNERLADLFGCSVEEWCAVEDFLGTFVDAGDREMFSRNYSKAIGHLQGPIRFRFKAVRKDGKKIDLETDMVPLTFGGHAVAYHFVRKA